MVWLPIPNREGVLYGRLARPLQLGLQLGLTVEQAKAAHKLPPRSSLSGPATVASHTPARRRRCGPVTLDGGPTSRAVAASVEARPPRLTASPSFAAGGARPLVACNRCTQLAGRALRSQISQIGD